MATLCGKREREDGEYRTRKGDGATMAKEGENDSCLFLALSCAAACPFFYFSTPTLKCEPIRAERVDPVCGFLKIGFGGVVDVDEFLWIAVDQRELTPLDLNHDFVSSFGCVMNIIQKDLLVGLARREGGSGFERLLRNLPRMTSARTSIWNPPKVPSAPDAGPFCALSSPIVGINVNQLDDEIGVGSPWSRRTDRRL